MHNPWSVCEWGPVPHIASRLTTIIGAFRSRSTGNQTKSESTENNMMLAGIPPRTGGTSGHGLVPVQSPITGLQKVGGGVR